MVSPKTPQFSKNGKLRHKSVKVKEQNSQTGQNLDPKKCHFLYQVGHNMCKKGMESKSEHGSLDRNLSNSLTLESLNF